MPSHNIPNNVQLPPELWHMILAQKTADIGHIGRLNERKSKLIHKQWTAKNNFKKVKSELSSNQPLIPLSARRLRSRLNSQVVANAKDRINSKSIHKHNLTKVNKDIHSKVRYQHARRF